MLLKYGGAGISLRTSFNSFGYTLRSWTAGLYRNFIFNLLRNVPTLFHCGYIIFIFPIEYKGSYFSVFLTTLIISCFSFFKKLQLSSWVWSISCCFDLHFPMTNDIEHLFMYVLAICISVLEKGLLVLCLYLNGVVCLFVVEL